MIARSTILRHVKQSLARSRIVVLTGPRQCGKTTLARELLNEESENYFDLEDPLDLARLDQPLAALAPLTDLVVIDEVQRRPELFPILRVLADRRGTPTHFLILGSASGDLLRQTSESLAGRMESIDISGFTLDELDAKALPTLWRRGGFPLSYLARNDIDSMTWRSNFIKTLLERDLPQWGGTRASHRITTVLDHARSLPRADMECG
jgi:predicted AAA+ superfamily ATPase